MAYDEGLAARIRDHVSDLAPQATERRMFGGLAFLIGGHMAVCVSGRGGLMVRVPPEQTEQLLGLDHVEPMIMAGRETRGWVRVGDDGVGTARALRAWVDRGVGYAKNLPPK